MPPAAQVRRTALYVDDHALNRLMMENLFDGLQGWVLEVAQDAHTCFERVARSTPQLVLLDINLDGIKGTDLLRRLRQIPGLRAVPAVAVSADGRPADIEAARKAGFDGYWVKPIEEAQVERTLARLFS